MRLNLRLAMLPILLILFIALPMPLSTTKAQGTIQSVADIVLKLPFRPGSEWTTTAGWEVAKHQQDWNWNAVDFVPVVGSCLGQAIIAAAPGFVRNTNTGAGTRFARHEVEIDHGTFNGINYRTLYVHLDTITVNDGAQVSYGTQIGTCGGYPNFIPHLHFQLFQGPTWNATDGLIPVPIDGITDQNRLRSQKRGLYSTNSGITPPKMDINTPGDGQAVAGHFLIGGWAIHEAAASGTGVFEIHIYFDGGPGSGARSVAATYGIRRDDVAAVFGDRYRYAGYQFELESSELSIGQHTINVYAHSTVTHEWQVMSRTFTIVNTPPDIPTQATPTNGDTASGPTVQFTWQDPGDPDNRPRNYRDYTVEVKNSAGQIVAQMPWTATTAWNANLADGTYTWHIQSGDGAQGSGWSADWNFTVSTTIAKPSNLAGEAVAEGIRLTWQDNATNETGHRIYRWRGEDQTWPLIGEVAGTEFTDIHAVCGVAYSYLVSAFNSSSESEREGWVDVSMSACPSLGAPSNFQVSTAAMHDLTLTWQDNASDEQGFKIYRWNGVDWPLYATLGPDVTSYTDINLLCAEGFSYRVAAFNAAGEAIIDGWLDGFTTACPTISPAPTGLQVTSVTQSEVKLSWQDSADTEISFFIYRRPAADTGAEFLRIALVGANSTVFQDTELICNTTYLYQVSAWNDAGESSRTAAVPGATNPCDPVLIDSHVVYIPIIQR